MFEPKSLEEIKDELNLYEGDPLHGGYTFQTPQGIVLRLIIGPAFDDPFTVIHIRFNFNNKQWEYMETPAHQEPEQALMKFVCQEPLLAVRLYDLPSDDVDDCRHREVLRIPTQNGMVELSLAKFSSDLTINVYRKMFEGIYHE